MKLLMLTGDTEIARGRQGAFYQTLRAFATYWERIDILTPHVPQVAHHERFENVHVYPSPWPKLLQPLYIRRQGSKLASERNYDLIVSHDYGLQRNGWGALWLSKTIGTPYASEIHHVDGYPRAANLLERITPRLTRVYVRFARRRALGFRVTNAQELKPLLLGWGVPESQIYLLYSLYLDFDVFHPETSQPDFDALFVGRLTPNKAPFLFLEGLAHARDRLPDLRALIVGQGPLEAQLKRRAAELGLEANVTFRGWVENQGELVAIYRRAKCLVCTSFSEGGPRVVAEALACGVPVITTRVGLARELVQDEHNGFQIDWSEAELADRLLQLLSDEALRKRLGAAAPQAVQRFEKARVIREYALGYQRLVIGD